MITTKMSAMFRKNKSDCSLLTKNKTWNVLTYSLDYVLIMVITLTHIYSNE